MMNGLAFFMSPGVPVAMFYVVDRFAAVYHGRGGLIIFSRQVQYVFAGS